MSDFLYLSVPPVGDGQVDFEEFMTILGPKLLSSDNREGFLGNTIDNIFWQVRHGPERRLFHLTIMLFEALFAASSSLLAVDFSIQSKSYILKHSPSFCRECVQA